MKPWQKWLLAALLIIVAIETYLLLRPDPKDKTIQQLQADKSAALKKNDLLNVSTATVVMADSLLNIRYKKDTIRFRIIMDSLTARGKAADLRYAAIKVQLKQTVDALTAGITDSALLNQLINLKAQLNDASTVVDFLRSNNNAKDSIMADAIETCNSTMSAKDTTIASLLETIRQKDALIAQLNGLLDTAIAELKKGKKKNILRTVAEAVGVVGLILLLK